MALRTANQSYGKFEEIMTDPSTIALWHVCAGPLVNLPKKNYPVYYFPEGHMEQLDALIGPVPKHNLPPLNLPSKILCEVDDLCLLVEPETDEVFSKINLKPTTDIRTVTLLPEPEEKCTYVSFCKILTPSDTNTSGGLSIPRKPATNCLPPLDMTKDVPSQALIAVDLHDKEWHFKHTLRGNPKRYLLTTGWSAFVTSKKLMAGDGFVFLKEENVALRVGVRRVINQLYNTSDSVISPEGMHFGLLATAAHSLENTEIFSVYYKPRTMRPNFVVSVDKYLEAQNWKIDVGFRFTMGFEDQDGLEKRFSGTVVGLGANESQYWGNSEWRCLKVQWDDPSAFMPERVSPWEIKPLVAPSQSQPSAPLSNKQAGARGPSPSDDLRRFFAESSSDEPLCSPRAETSILVHGGINSSRGGPSGLSLWQKHGDEGEKK